MPKFYSFPSLSKFQSAYRKFYSTETALTRIYNDLVLSINKQKISALVLLDLSAAFDTIDNSILLTRLEYNFGITGTALSLVTSYLQNRSQAVLIRKDCSPACSLLTGVPQGSVLGPLLFCLYTTPLSYIFYNSDVSYRLYADDTQLYISFSSSDSVNSFSILSSTLDSVYSWFSSNRLSVNPSKTKFLLIGTPQQRSKLNSSSISFHGNNLAQAF
jgi:Reverse transcriptase (RNA-dependent DNA polymerase)